MNVRKGIFFIFIIISFGSLSCKKGKDGDPGPAGLDPNAPLFQNGTFVNGTIQTKQEDSTATVFTFDYTYLNLVDFFDGTEVICYAYANFTDGIGSHLAYCNISFNKALLEQSILNHTAPTSFLMEIGAITNNPSGTTYSFHGNLNQNNIVINNYFYDADSRTITFDYASLPGFKNDKNILSSISGKVKLANLLIISN